MTVKTSTLKGGIGIIDVQGNLVGGEETVVFQQAIIDLLNQQCRKLVVDFKDVNFINSTGLGALISAHTSAVRRGSQLLLCNINNSVSSLLVITGLNRILNVKKNREEAVMVPA
jgi:anti-sigma B factor antagonist